MWHGPRHLIGCYQMDAQSGVEVGLGPSNRVGLTPEIIARVDAWLAARWPNAGAMSRDEAFLVGMWVTLKGDIGPYGNIGAGVAAAMSGVILALVREAWGGCDVYTNSPAQVRAARATVEIRWPLKGCVSHWENRRSFFGASLAEALVAALEAAPLPGQAVES